MKLITSVVAISLLATGSTLLGSVVVSYDFNVSNTNQASSALVSAGAVTAPWSGNFMGNVFSGAFRDSANDLIAADVAGALLTSRYSTFTITPEEPVNFTRFEVTLGALNNTGSVTYTGGLAVFSSLTGFTAAAVLGTDSITLAPSSGIVDNATPLSIDLSSVLGLQNVSTPVEFRIYFTDDYGTNLTTLNVRQRDISVEAVAVPEPTTYGLLLGLAALGWAWKRRRSARSLDF